MTQRIALVSGGMGGIGEHLCMKLADAGHRVIATHSPGNAKILPQIPLGRLGKPEEIAALVTWLASDDAAFVTGADFSINGGQHMS